MYFVGLPAGILVTALFLLGFGFDLRFWLRFGAHGLNLLLYLPGSGFCAQYGDLSFSHLLALLFGLDRLAYQRLEGVGVLVRDFLFVLRHELPLVLQ